METPLWQGIRLCACPMRRLLVATTLAFALLPSAAAFAADNPQDLLIDACRDEKVDGTYSQSTYRRALSELPADSDQYTACRDVINRARLAALNTPRDSSSGGGSGGGTTGGGGGGGGPTAGTTGSHQARRSGSGSSTSAPSSNVDVLATATPDEQSAVQRAARSGAAPVRVGGELLKPGAVGTLSTGHRELPASLLVLLAALAACLLAAAAAVGWNRVLVRRTR